MLKVYDKNMKPIGILENAFDAGIERRANELWTASFSMPIDNSKISFETYRVVDEVLDDTVT